MISKFNFLSVYVRLTYLLCTFFGFAFIWYAISLSLSYETYCTCAVRALALVSSPPLSSSAWTGWQHSLSAVVVTVGLGLRVCSACAYSRIFAPSHLYLGRKLRTPTKCVVLHESSCAEINSSLHLIIFSH
jgi:hypothetical protein